jgi:hypothetical protein
MVGVVVGVRVGVASLRPRTRARPGAGTRLRPGTRARPGAGTRLRPGTRARPGAGTRTRTRPRSGTRTRPRTCLRPLASRIDVVVRVVVIGVVVVGVENRHQNRNRRPVRGWGKTHSSCWLRGRGAGFRRCGWNSHCKERSNKEKYEQYPLWPSWCVPWILLVVPVALGHNIDPRGGLSPHSRHQVITSTLRTFADGAINPRKHETAHFGYFR